MRFAYTGEDPRLAWGMVSVILKECVSDKEALTKQAAWTVELIDHDLYIGAPEETILTGGDAEAKGNVMGWPSTRTMRQCYSRVETQLLGL